MHKKDCLKSIPLALATVSMLPPNARLSIQSEMRVVPRCGSRADWAKTLNPQTSGLVEGGVFYPVPAPIDYPAVLAGLENELVNLITESLWQLERITELQEKIRAVTRCMEQGIASMTFPPVSAKGSLN